MSRNVVVSSGVTWQKSTLAQKFIAVLLAVSLAFGMCPNVGFADPAAPEPENPTTQNDPSDTTGNLPTDNGENPTDDQGTPSGDATDEGDGTDAGTPAPQNEDDPDGETPPATNPDDNQNQNNDKEEPQVLPAPAAVYDVVFEKDGEIVSAKGETVSSDTLLTIQMTWDDLSNVQFEDEKAELSREYSYDLPKNLTLSEGQTSGKVMLPEAFIKAGAYASEDADAPKLEELELGEWTVADGKLYIKYKKQTFYLQEGQERVATTVSDLKDLGGNPVEVELKSVVSPAAAEHANPSGNVDLKVPGFEGKNKFYVKVDERVKPTTEAKLTVNWVDNANDSNTRPDWTEGTDEKVRSLFQLKKTITKGTGEEATTETVLVDIPADATIDLEQLAQTSTISITDLLASETVEGETVTYSYSIVPKEDFAVSKYIVYPQDKDQKDNLSLIQMTDFTINVQGIDGANTTNGQHPDLGQAVQPKLNLIGTPAWMGKDAPASDWNYSADQEPAGVYGPSTGVAKVTFPGAPKYDYDPAKKTSTEITYNLTIESSKQTICGKETEVFKNGNDTYEVIYDNTAVPNKGMESDKAYDGSTLKLALKDQTEYKATKFWLDNEKAAGRPTSVTYELWRFTNTKDGSKSYKTASPVRDDDGNKIVFKTDGTKQESVVPLDKDLNAAKGVIDGADLVKMLGVLPKYDGNGYEYIYLLRESMSGGTESYQKVFTDVDGDKLTAEKLPTGITRDATDESIYNGGSIANRIYGTVTPTTEKTWIAASYIDAIGQVSVSMTLQQRTKADGDTPAGKWEDAKDGEGKAIVDTKSGFGATDPSQTYSASRPKFNSLGEELEYRWVESAIVDPAKGEGNILADGKFQLQLNVKNSTDDPAAKTLGKYTDLPRQNEEWFASVSDEDQNKVTNVIQGKEDYYILKQWMTGTDPTAVSFHLIGSDGKTYTINLDGEKNDKQPALAGSGVEAAEVEPWLGRVTDLPKYDEKGNLILYRVQEVQGESKYSVGYHEETDLRKATVTNGPGDGVEIQVEKRWIDDHDDSCRYPSEVEVWFKDPANDSEIPVTKNDAGDHLTVTLSQANAWFMRVGIPSSFYAGKDDSYRNAANYFLRETRLKSSDESKSFLVEAENSAATDYHQQQVVTTDRHMYVVDDGPNHRDGGVIWVSNRRVGTVDVTVTKKWVDENVWDSSARPQMNIQLHSEQATITDNSVSVEGVLTVNIPTKVNIDTNKDAELSKPLSTFAITPDGAKAVAQGVYTFKDLPKYDKDGKVIEYSVSEEYASDAEKKKAQANSYNQHAEPVTYTPEIIPAAPKGSASAAAEPASLWDKFVSLFAISEPVSEEEHDLLTTGFVNKREASVDVVFYKEWDDNYAYLMKHRPDIYVELYKTADLVEPNSGKAFDDNEPKIEAVGYRTNKWDQDNRMPSQDPKSTYIGGDRTNSLRYWKVTFPSQPRFNDNGAYITYYASELQNGSSEVYDYKLTSFKDNDCGVVTHEDATHAAHGHWVEPVASASVLKENGTFVNKIEAEIKLKGKKVWERLPDGYIGEIPTIDVTLMRNLPNEKPYEVKVKDAQGVERLVKLTDIKPEEGSTAVDFSIMQMGDTPTYEQKGNNFDYSPEKYDANGDIYTYQFGEKITIKSRTEGIDLNDLYKSFTDGNLVVHNVYMPDDANYRANLSVTKTWTGLENIDPDTDDVKVSGKLPSATFVLHRIYQDKSGKQTDTTVETKKVNASDWKTAPTATFTFSNLPIFAPDGFQYIYYLTENSVNGYDSTVTVRTQTSDPAQATVISKSDVRDGAFAFAKPDAEAKATPVEATAEATNKYAPKFVALTGEKVWGDQAMSDLRPSLEQFQSNLKLYRWAAAESGQNNAIGSADKMITVDPSKYTITVTEKQGSNTAYTIKVVGKANAEGTDGTGLDAIAPNGQYWNYVVKEDLNAIAETDFRYSTNYTDGANWTANATAVKNATKDNYAAAVAAPATMSGSSTAASNQGKNSLKGKVNFKKKWEGQGYTFHPAVYFELQVKIGNDGWKPAYSVKPFNKAAIVADRNQANYIAGNITTNTWTGMIAASSNVAQKEVTKTWNEMPLKVKDDNDAWQTVLYRFVEIKVGDWEIWKNNPNDRLANQVTYPTAQNGQYQPSTENNVHTTDTFDSIVKNTRIGGYVDLPVEKKWEKDQDDAYKTRPGSLTFNVMSRAKGSQDAWAPVLNNQGAQVTITISKATGWKGEIKDLPAYKYVYDATGAGQVVELEYKADEVPVKNYTHDANADTVTYTAGGSEGANGSFKTVATNVLALVDLHGAKVWNAATDVTDLDKGKVKLTLYRSSSAVAKEKVTYAKTSDGQPTWKKDANNRFTFTYSDLPGLDTAGNKFTYWVEETIPSGYALTGAITNPTGTNPVYTDLHGEGATPTDDNSYYTQGDLTNTITALKLNKNITDKGQTTTLSDKKLKLELWKGAVKVATWTRESGNDGTFALVDGIKDVATFEHVELLSTSTDTIYGLPKGDYQIKEPTAGVPDHVAIPEAETIKTFTLNDTFVKGADVTKITVNADNTLYRRDIEVTKSIAGGKSASVKVGFDLYKGEYGKGTPEKLNTQGTLYTNANGKWASKGTYLEGLEVGKYFIMETETESTTALPKEESKRVVSFEIVHTKMTEATVLPLSLTDEAFEASLELKKYDGNNGALLNDAKFTLTRIPQGATQSETVFEDKAVTDGQLQATLTKKGAYTLTETTVPSGYRDVDADFSCTFTLEDRHHETTFEINEDQAAATADPKVTLVSGAWYVKGEKKGISNTPLELQLDKVIDGKDAFNKDGLTLTLTRGADTVATWTRAKNEEGKYEGRWTLASGITNVAAYKHMYIDGQKLFALPAGDYKITESDTLAEYELADPITFKLDGATGVVSDVAPEKYATVFAEGKGVGVTVNNITYSAGLKWTKKDENTASAFDVLKTAEFKLQYKFHDSDTKWTDVEIGGKTTIKWDEAEQAYYAPILKRGTYRIVETKAPEGFKQITAAEKASEFGGRYCGEVTYANAQNKQTLAYEVYFDKTPIVNTPSKMTLDKVSTADKKPIGDAELELQITDADGVLVYTWTRAAANEKPAITKAAGLNEKYFYSYVAEDEDVKYIYALPAGTYTVTETSTPLEFTTAAPVQFVVNEDGSITSDALVGDKVTVTMEDVPFKTSVSWLKQDVETGEALTAWFELVGPEGSEKCDKIKITEDPEGSYSAELTKRGKYTLTEVTQPKGYPDQKKNHFVASFEVQDVDNGKPFIIADGQKTAENDDTLPATATKKESSEITKTEGTWNEKAITNTRITGSLAFVKEGLYNETCADGTQADAASLTRLSGVEFTIYEDKECTKVAKNYKGEDLIAVSDPETGVVKFTDILADWNEETNDFKTTYYMKETAAPAGYKLLNTLFQLDMTGAIDDDVLTATLTVAEQGAGDVADVLRQTMIPASQLEAKPEAAPVNPILAFFGLASDDQDEAADGENITVPMIVNDVLRTDLIVKKRSELDKNVFVEGAVFGLFRAPLKQSEVQIDELDGRESQVKVAEATTDANGKLTFAGLLANQTYTIRELSAPAGYLVSKHAIKVTMTANESGDALVIALDKTDLADGTAEIDPATGEILWNDPQTQIRVEKVDMKGNLIAGAKMHIEDADGNVVVKKWVSSSKEGQLITGLVAGQTYYLIEDRAPDGFIKAEEPKEFTVNDKPRAAGENYVQLVKLKNKVDPGDPRPGDDDDVKTGDSAKLPLAVGFAGLVSAAIAAFAVRRRRRAADEAWWFDAMSK